MENKSFNSALSQTSPIIAPSILSADLLSLGKEVKDVENCGADWLHVDVMDGSFVPPITWGAGLVEELRAHTALFLDVHLMIVNPEKHIQAFAAAGSNTLIVHRETCAHLHRTLALIKETGLLSAACVNPGTPVSELFDVLELCDFVLIMSVNPGWGGQKFIESSIKKIAALKAEITRQKLSTRIEVDGGINAETAARCVAAGADILVAGSYIFGSKDRLDAINKLKAQKRV